MPKNDYLLAEFEAWCEGAGRGGKGAGKHFNSLAHIANFRAFKAEQEIKRNALEKQANKVKLP